MLCLMWEYFQRSQNACSVSSALHQLTGTLLIRQRSEGISVGGREEEVEGVEKMSVPVCALHPIYFHPTLESFVFPCLWLHLVTSGKFNPGKHESSPAEIESLHV